MDNPLNRRQLLGGIAVAAGTAALLEGLGARSAAAAAAPAADAGTSQAPTITDVTKTIAPPPPWMDWARQSWSPPPVFPSGCRPKTWVEF